MFTFQCLDWFIQDTESDTDTDTFTVHVFGKTQTGNSVCLHVNDYKPYICYKVNPKLQGYYTQFFELLQKQLIKWRKNEDDAFEIVLDASSSIEKSDGLIKKKSLWGYNLEKTEKFFKFEFKSLSAFKKIKYLLSNCQKFSSLFGIVDAELFYKSLCLIDYPEQYSFIQSFARDKYTKSDQCICEGQSVKCQDCVLGARNFMGYLTFLKKLGHAHLPLNLAMGQLFDVIDPILRFAHDKDIKMAGWLNVDEFDEILDDEKISTCQTELACTYSDLSVNDKIDTICTSIKEMAFDIESYSPDDKFPDANEPECVVYQIGITLKLYSDKIAKRILLHYKGTGVCKPITGGSACIRGISEAVPELCGNKECLKTGKHLLSKVDVNVINYSTERELLLGFTSFINLENPDLIYGYNSDGFDWKYLFNRAIMCNCIQEFSRLSRLVDYTCTVKEQKFQSSAYGDNVYYKPDVPGRLNLDLMIWIQRNMPADRYPDYKLDTIAEIEISQKKHDISFKDIFRAYREGDSELMTKVGDYCLQDTILVQKLVSKLDVVTQLFEMSNLSSVPVSYLLAKGQQIKVFSIISKDAASKGFLVPNLDLKDNNSFTGAIVLEPTPGLFQTPVAVLDFASLYPSIQVAYKICYSTVVLDSNLIENLTLKKDTAQPLKIGDVLFDYIEWQDQVIQKGDCTWSNAEAAKKDTGISKKIILDSIAKNHDFKMHTKKNLFFFAQNTQSIIPSLQTNLKKSRKNVKGMMALLENSENPDDKLRYRVLNGRQLAIKVTMNSIYGFTSAFMLNMSALSACVTAKGRQMIESTRNFMENDFEKIAQNQKWTEKDICTYFTKEGRQVTTSSIPDSGWIRKYPSARLDEPWASNPLKIKVVGGDTDSVFCNFPNSTLEETISLNHKAEVILTEKVFNRSPIEMEYEKTYVPMVIVKKKNYIGVKYEMGVDRWKVDYKGIAIKRRNYCTFVKQVYWNIIYPILGIEKDGNTLRKVDWHYTLGPQKALEALKSTLFKLFSDNLDYNDFTISASLKSSYKSENLPHVDLARRMNERNSGVGAPKSGQRFSYIIVNDDTRGVNLYSKSEDLTFAIENGLPLDLLFYLNNQIRKPISTFLSLSCTTNDINDIFGDVEATLFEKLRQARNKTSIEAKRNFFSSKRPSLPIVPLKPPKKQKKKAVLGDLRDYFGV